MDGNLMEEELSYRIRGCVFEVYRQLGAGFLEKVYERALLLELRSAGLKVEAQVPLAVHYKGCQIGHFAVDLVVEDRVLLELKAVSALRPEHQAQIINYLKASGLRLGLLINFAQPKAQVKRVVL